MLLFLKSSSKRVKNEKVQDIDDDLQNNKEVATASSSSTSTSLTVWRKSLVFSCNGFTVIGSDGSLVFRVDNYSGHPHQIILMDGHGNPILTICRHKEKLRLVDNWLIYEGDIEGHSAAKISSKKPIFCVRKQKKMLQGNLKVLAHVYRGGISDRRLVYVIEGSYVHRSCKVFDESRRMVVAEIKKKQSTVSHGGVCVSFGLEVFVLVVRQGFDSGFAMAMVLLLDQMFS
ncbi:PREDICTED: protein LURP-one-related 17 [Ipomoea nil]|uniref:protein LURP-one-related 17 n=1 Tax=Ipomoea nil TaxID=35883 RepID=UPI000900F837|nr:PREDICTED: protein LURP-one-related 17 [Ipomoea nil]